MDLKSHQIGLRLSSFFDVWERTIFIESCTYFQSSNNLDVLKPLGYGKLEGHFFKLVALYSATE
jgi:hypothetical protein